MTSSRLELMVADLEARHHKIKERASRLDDVLEITNLQTRYNLWLELDYYERIWNELFANKNPKVKCEIGESGVYEGPESLERFWKAMAGRERKQGYMANIMILDPYIVVSKDGKTAKCMAWAFGPHADNVTPSPGDQKKLTAYWFFGKYDNEFNKEKGQWKILSLHTIVYLRTPFDKGWLVEPDCARWQVPDGAPPDKPSTLIDFYHPGGQCEWKPWVYPYESIE